MKTVIKNTALFSLLIFIVSLFSYHKDRKNSSSNIVKIITGGSSYKAWKLYKIIYNGTEQAMSPCYRNYNRLFFYADGTYSKSSYKCDDGSCGNFSAQQPENGTWKLEPEDEMLNLGVHNYKLLSVVTGELVLKINNTKYYYTEAENKLLSQPQLLAGTLSKTWNYSKCVVDGLEQELTAEQKLVRFTNKADGTLITNYTNPNFGKNITGTWTFNQEGNTYTIVLPASASHPALKQTYTIVELTDNTFIITYTDVEGRIIELHEVLC